MCHNHVVNIATERITNDVIYREVEKLLLRQTDKYLTIQSEPANWPFVIVTFSGLRGRKWERDGV